MKKRSRAKFSKAARATAYHEAGHAVTKVLLRRGIKDATIVPDEESWGRVRPSTRIADPDSQAQGEKWEPLGNDPKLWEREARSAKVQDALLGRKRSRARADIAITLAGPRAERRFAGRSNPQGARSDRRQASLVAERLAEEGLTPGLVYNQERARAKRLLDENWPAVRAVASALLAKRTLTGKQVRQIVKRPIGRRSRASKG